MVANWTQVRRTGLARVGAVLLILATACGGGGRGNGDGSAASRFSSSTAASAAVTTTTVAVTTTTLSAEEQVKAAYLKYWEVVDAAFASPDAGVNDLATVAGEPLLSSLADQLATKAAQGRRYVTSAGRPNEHRIQGVSVTASSATVTDCWIDGTTEITTDGTIIDDAISSKLYNGTLAKTSSGWSVINVTKVSASSGAGGCGA